MSINFIVSLMVLSKSLTVANESPEKTIGRRNRFFTS